MNPFSHTGLSISDSLKSVRKSVLIYETIIPVLFWVVTQLSTQSVRNAKPPAMRVRVDCYTKKYLSCYNEVVQATL